MRRSMLSLLLLLLLILLLQAAYAQQVPLQTPAGTRLLLYTPPGYSSSTSTYPMLLVLHGGGEIGDDLSLLTSTPHQIPARLIQLKQWPADRPFIVVTPQLKRDTSIPNPNDQEWPTAYVDEVVEYVRGQYRIDGTRIYVTGISLGGAGAWDYAAAKATKVAALVPISGKANTGKACAVKNIPVWAFHGEGDALVRPQFSIDMINAITACSPAGKFKPRLTLLQARIHEGWTEVYNGTNGYDIYSWMLRFRKNNTANVAPYAQAGADYKIQLRTQPFHLQGDAFDWNGNVASTTWSQTAGPTVTWSGKTTLTPGLTKLQTGTYEFQLTVKDNQGATTTDRVTLEVGAAATPAVTAMTLMNGKTNADIGPMSEGQTITTSATLAEINIRATATSGTGSVRFSINTDQHTRTVNSPGPYLIKKQASTPEWAVKPGVYRVCATPYPQGGAKGTPGQTLCYQFTVAAASTKAELADDSLATALSVYPNPAKRELHVSGSQANSSLSYTLINSAGKAVARGEVSNATVLLPESLPRGWYTLQLHGTRTYTFQVLLEP